MCFKLLLITIESISRRIQFYSCNEEKKIKTCEFLANNAFKIYHLLHTYKCFSIK